MEYVFCLFLQTRWQTHIDDATTIRDVTIPAVTTAQVTKYNLNENAVDIFFNIF
jgi:hypothetical protein